MAAYSRRFSRRAFVAGASSFAALHSAANLLPLRPVVAALQNDSRLSQTVVAGKGFASVRRVGNGLYAAISDTTKGLQTMCNGGFLAGKDSALLLEGLVSPAGAAFQMDAFRSVSKMPIKAALDTHCHFDHSTGTSFRAPHRGHLRPYAGCRKIGRAGATRKSRERCQERSSKAACE